MSDKDNQLDAFATDDDLAHLLQEIDKLPEAQRSLVMSKIPVVLQSLVALFAAKLKKGVKDPQEDAESLVVALAHYLGGMPVYLPRNERLVRELRNIRIYAEHGPNNIEELARRYKLTTSQVYNIIAEQTVIERNRRQMSLF